MPGLEHLSFYLPVVHSGKENLSSSYVLSLVLKDARIIFGLDRNIPCTYSNTINFQYHLLKYKFNHKRRLFLYKSLICFLGG